MLQQAECADNILVKHYRGIDSNNYKMSDILDKEVTSYIVHDLTPDAEYTYQVGGWGVPGVGLSIGATDLFMLPCTIG